MPSTFEGYVLGAIRFVLVVGGIVFAVGSIYAVLTIPPPPPDSDGFATGMAYLVGGVILVVSLGVTGLGVTLPAMLGTDDPLGFNDYQRWILKIGGVFFVGGFLVNVVVALALGLETGLILWFGTILVGVLAVCLALAWRLGEVLLTVLRANVIQ